MDDSFASSNPISISVVLNQLQHGPMAQYLVIDADPKVVDRTIIEAQILALQQKTQARVFVVAFPPTVEVDTYKDWYEKLHMKDKDLLFLYNGQYRHLHCKALSKDISAKILKNTKNKFYSEPIEGTKQMLESILQQFERIESKTSTLTSNQPNRPQKTSRYWTEIGISMAAILILFAAIFWNRRKTNR